MDHNETSRWQRAATLLNDLLELPPGERQAAAKRLGQKAGVEAELGQLVQGLKDESILDESVDAVIDKLGPASDSLTGQILGDWLVKEEIGRGGMSIVYRAIRKGERFEQVAALKVLAAEFLSDSHIESFHRECQALSALSHPGIAKLIHSGIAGNGQPYLVIEHIDGQPIDEYVREHNLDTRSCIELMTRLTQAVAHAHRHLFVHRDIKPGNVLVDHRGDPHLLDFGVVQWMETDQSSNTLHAYSPGFAPPEQVSEGAVSTAVDIYSLGKLLEHLTGISGTDNELSAIADKACAENPNDRYPDATRLAADLEAWLTLQPVQAVQGGWDYRARKFSRRNWRWLGLASALLLAISAGLIATNHQARQAKIEAERHQAIANFMLSLFEQADVLNAGAEMKVTELLEDAAARAPEQLSGQPRALAALYTLIASGQTELTNYEAARNALDRTREIIEEVGLSALQQSGYHIQQARLFYELGEYDSAEQQAAMAMDLVSPRGESADIYFTAGTHRVSYLVDAEHYESALELADFLVNEIAIADVSGITIALLRHRRAIALEVNGKIAEALGEYRNALSLQQEAAADNELQRAQILGDLGIALYSNQDYAEAEAVLNQVITIFKTHFEEPHPRISSAMHNLAFVILEQGRTEETLEILRHTLDMSVALHGPDHIDTILERVTYGVVLQDAGDEVQAEAIYRDALSKLETIAPEMSVMRGNVHTYMGDLKFKQQDYRLSRTHYQLALSLYSDLPADHPRVVEAERRLAELMTRPR